MDKFKKCAKPAVPAMVFGSKRFCRYNFVWGKREVKAR
jgi:hypothetical protein